MCFEKMFVSTINSFEQNPRGVDKEGVKPQQKNDNID